jgi:stage II sporulation protein AA (anti-sigma F factor antagonist)
VPNQDAVVWYLRVEQEESGSVIVLTASGRISSLTCSGLESALASAIASPARGVVLDLSNVDYISSPGLRAVASASTRLTGEGRMFVVCGLRDAVSVAFTLGGLAATVTMEPSRNAAIVTAAAAT